MALTDTIQKIMQNFEKKTSGPEAWNLLKKSLKKKGYNKKDYVKILDEVAFVGLHTFLEVWETLDKHIFKEKFKWGKYDDLANIRIIRKLCDIDNIKDSIKALGEIGYFDFSIFQTDWYSYIVLKESNLNVFQLTAKNGVYKKYSQIFKALKRLEYQGLNLYETSNLNQFDSFTKINDLDGNSAGAIYLLASKGYKIDRIVGITKLDIQNIEQVLEEAQKEITQAGFGISVHLYETGNIEIFQEYFENLRTEDKKSVLESIMKYEIKEEQPKPENREQIQKWLEKSHPKLMGEVYMA